MNQRISNFGESFNLKINRLFGIFSMSFVMLIKRKKKKMKREKKTSGKPFNEPNDLNRIHKKHLKKPVFFSIPLVPTILSFFPCLNCDADSITPDSHDKRCVCTKIEKPLDIDHQNAKQVDSQ